MSKTRHQCSISMSLTGWRYSSWGYSSWGYLEQGLDDKHQHSQGGCSSNHLADILDSSSTVDGSQGDVCCQARACRITVILIVRIMIRTTRIIIIKTMIIMMMMILTLSGS